MSILSAIFGPLVPQVEQPPKIAQPPSVDDYRDILRRVVGPEGPLFEPLPSNDPDWGVYNPLRQDIWGLLSRPPR